MPPSYHVIFTAGLFPRAANSKKVEVELGKQTSLNGVEIVSMLVGMPSSSAQNGKSIRCAPMSPSAPWPQSTQPRQLNG